jgi:hypothetical protein
MASQQAYQFHAQNKGTLAPGQLVNVNKYNVRVDRYLAQGVLKCLPELECRELTFISRWIRSRLPCTDRHTGV